MKRNQPCKQCCKAKTCDAVSYTLLLAGGLLTWCAALYAIGPLFLF